MIDITVELFFSHFFNSRFHVFEGCNMQVCAQILQLVDKVKQQRKTKYHT